MRIGLDIRKYHDFGIGTYIRNIVEAFLRNAEIDPVLFGGRSLQREIPGAMNKGTFVADESGKYSLTELFALSYKANRRHLDLYHAPHYTLPVGLRCPSIVTIHDIIHLRLRQYFSAAQRAYASVMIGHACRNSDAVIVDSHFGKEELLRVFRIPERKITVVHLGVERMFLEPVAPETLSEFRRKNGITQPYILYTGSLKPHKNVITLFRAFQQLVKRHAIQLVLAGEGMANNEMLRSFVHNNGLSGAIVDLGKISKDELPTVYQSAAVVVLPSYYEGFGFSMVEAMASGVPAIGAQAASITEIVGDAGILFDPHSVAELEGAIERVLTDTVLRNSLVHKGRARVQQFTWDRCVTNTLDAYHKVIG